MPARSDMARMCWNSMMEALKRGRVWTGEPQGRKEEEMP